MPETDDNESLISHIEALRSTILKCLTAIAVVLPFTFFIAPKALNFFIDIIIADSPVKLNYFSPMEVFLIQIKTAIILDIILCFPYIIKKVWDFVLPALYENEKKIIKPVIILSTTLFIAGMLFCTFVILPLIIRFGLSFATPNIQAVFGISNIVTLSLWMAVAFGAMFQIPLVVYYLIKFEVIEYETVSDKRPYVIVFLLILAAIFTPPDVVSQILLFIPTYALFELGLLFARKSRR